MPSLNAPFGARRFLTSVKVHVDYSGKKAS